MSTLDWESNENLAVNEEMFQYFRHLYKTRHHEECPQTVVWNKSKSTIGITKERRQNDDVLNEIVQKVSTIVEDLRDFYVEKDLFVTKDELPKVDVVIDDLQTSDLSHILVLKQELSRRETLLVIMGCNDNDVRCCKHKLKVALERIRPRRRENRSATNDFLTYEGMTVKIKDESIDSVIGERMCVVNPTNSTFESSGNVSRALKAKGGDPFSAELTQLKSRKRVGVCECVATDGGNLPVNRVVHLVCPNNTLSILKEKNWNRSVFRSVFNCLETAEKENMETIAIPFIYTGKLGRSVTKCCVQYAYATLEYSRTHFRGEASSLKNIVFVSNKKADIDDATSVFNQCLPKSNGQFRITKELDDDMSRERSMFEDDADAESDTDHFSQSKEFSRSGPAASIRTLQSVDNFARQLDVCFVTRDIRSFPCVALISPVSDTDGETNDNDLVGASIKAAYHYTFADSGIEVKIKKLKASLTTKRATVTRCEQGDNNAGRAVYVFHLLVPIYENNTRGKERFQEGIHKAFEALIDRIESTNKKKEDIREVAMPLFGLNDPFDAQDVETVCQVIAECLCGVVSSRQKRYLMTKLNIVNRCPRVTRLFAKAFQQVQADYLRD